MSRAFAAKYAAHSFEYGGAFAIEEYYSYDIDRYLPADKRVYVEDMQDRAAAIAKTYFGLTDQDIQEIPNMSTHKLATVIEEGISS